FEGFFGRLKTEMYYGRKWSGITPAKFMQHVAAYIRWYNERRIKLSLGVVSPEMYRNNVGRNDKAVQEIVRIPLMICAPDLGHPMKKLA
ncbi:IS3 family transposase, partial [Escherichia coli]|nr:IS3 family transposase [Escherichia coli]